MASEVTLAVRIPKVHLHCHLEGTLRAPTFVELAARDGVALRYRPDETSADAFDVADPYRFSGFQEFLWVFAAVSRTLSRPEDYALLAREFVEDARAQNVMYGELFISPAVWKFFHPDLDVRQSVTAITEQLRAARPHAEFRLIVDVTRNFGAESALATAQLAASLTELDVVAIGLGGDEARFPAELFAEAFAFARAAGLHTVAHAGEAAGASSVRAAVAQLGAQRIGHGLSALDDPTTLELLASRRIALEVCPASNRLTGVANADRNALVEFDRAGCIVTIDADDPAIFKTSIQDEYAAVADAAGDQTLVRYVAQAIDASFAPANRKVAMQQRLAAELRSGRRTPETYVGP